MTVIVQNKRVRFDYDILETYEAGISLLGTEVKSVKQSKVNISGAHVSLFEGELYLVNCKIPLYEKSRHLAGYDPLRKRKLLLHKKEIKHLIGKLEVSGLTITLTKVYTKNNKIKVEIALVKGKKKYDKREMIKKREVSRQISRSLKYQ